MKEKLRDFLSFLRKYGIMAVRLTDAFIFHTARDRQDYAYWRDVFAMAGAAACAVAFVEGKIAAFVFGSIATFAGLQLDRKRRKKQ
jgi:hypothetical protein